MTEKVDRRDWFLRDGQYYPFHRQSTEVDWSHPALSVMHGSLWRYDNGQAPCLGDYEVSGNPRGHVVTPDHGEILEQVMDLTEPPPPPFSQVVPQAITRDVVAHYTTGKFEVIDYIYDQLGYEHGLAYVLGNLIKYSSRAIHKGQLKDDLVKIRNYATIALEQMEKNGELE